MKSFIHLAPASAAHIEAVIHYALGDCALGRVLVAMSEHGVCALSLGDDSAALIGELRSRFPGAGLTHGGAECERCVAKAVNFVEMTSLALDLPLDVRGTDFQQRVWQALRKIPCGARASYTEIAQQIGSPKAVRAVAGACAANTLAVAIPCHRAVRADGGLAGYRWGIPRKAELLRRECETREAMRGRLPTAIALA